MFKDYLREFLAFWTKLTKAERLTWGIAGVSFIVDLYAIIQILSHIQNQPTSESDGLAVSPWLAFAIWLLSLFAYITILHAYWQRNRIEAGYSSSYAEFLFIELLLEFRIPTLLFPFVIFLIILFFVAGMDVSGGALVILGIATAMGLIALVIFRADFDFEEFRDSKQSRTTQMVSQETKIWVDSNWEFLTKSVQTHLARKPFVLTDDFRTLQATRELSTVDLRYVLARYAEKHSDEVQFGAVWYRRDGEPESYDLLANDALANLSTFDYARFAIT